MPRLRAANRAHTTLDGALNDSSTTINVVDASVFSAPPFRAVIDPEGEGFEIVEVSTISANELTVTGRGVLPFPDDTAASAHGSGVVIAQMQTAGWSMELVSEDEAGGGLDGVVFRVAAADHVVNNTATPVSDNELSFEAGANEVWFYQLTYHFQQAVSGPNGWRFGLSIPTGSTSTRFGVAWSSSQVGITVSGTAVGAFPSSSTSLMAIPIFGLVVIGETPGTVVPQWAQNVAHESDSFRIAGSTLLAWRAL